MNAIRPTAVPGEKREREGNEGIGRMTAPKVQGLTQLIACRDYTNGSGVPRGHRVYLPVLFCLPCSLGAIYPSFMQCNMQRYGDCASLLV